MVTVVQGKVCAKNHPDRLSRLATIHQRYRRTDGRTDGRISYGIGLDLTVGQKVIQNPHEDPDQHQTLITSTGSFLAHPYHVSSTSITVIVSYLPTD